MRRNSQSKVLEALFEIFFRVLKATTASLGAAGAKQAATKAAVDKAAAAASGEGDGDGDGEAVAASPWPPGRWAKRFPLLAPTLEGLGAYTHLIRCIAIEGPTCRAASRLGALSAVAQSTCCTCKTLHSRPRC
jgi:hypothetical protein